MLGTSASDFRPAGEPQVLQDGADAWTKLADTAHEVVAELDVALRQASAAWTGPSADAFTQWWGGQSQTLTAFADQAAEMASELENGVDTCKLANGTFQVEAGILIAACASACAPMVPLAPPVGMAAGTALGLKAIDELSAEMVSIGATIAMAGFTAAATAAAVVVFAPAAPAVAGAGAAMTTAINAVIALVKAIISAVVALIISLIQSTMTKVFAFGSPFKGWTMKEVGALALQFGIDCIPIGFAGDLITTGFKFQNSILKGAIQVTGETLQSFGGQSAMNLYYSGAILDGFDIQVLIGLTAGIVVGSLLDPGGNDGDAAAARTPSAPPGQPKFGSITSPAASYVPPGGPDVVDRGGMEYPYGSANTIPHIHQYGPDAHLKIMDGSRIRRIQLVQNGKRYGDAVAEAFALARASGNMNLVEAIKEVIRDTPFA